MKRFLLVTFLWGLFFSADAVTFYSQGSQAPNLTSSWNSVRGGGGITPSDFLGIGDIFVIQNGHTMITTATWLLGVSTSKLQIESGGTLVADNSVQLPGAAFVFQIDNGGRYVHNNNAFIASTPGTSIWSATESFAVNSTVEIRNWINNIAALSSTISWGNLVINVTNIGGSWNQQGNVTIVQGNLQIISSGLPGEEFRITGNTNTVLSIGGNLIVDGGGLRIKSANDAGTSCVVQVNGNVSVNNSGSLNVGTADVVFNSELRFKGNFNASSISATVSSADNFSYLVANGTTLQTFTCSPLLNCNFRVASGSTVNQSGSMANGAGKVFAVLGTYNDNGFTNTFSGALEVAGGTFNSTGPIAMGANRCRSCTGDGTYPGLSALWCTGTGSRGLINFTGNTVTFTQSSASQIYVGSGAPGDIYLTNAIINFDAGGTAGSIILSGGSELSLDGGSVISGLAAYTGSGGTLRIGSPEGITVTGNTTNGNIRIGGAKNYNGATSGNNFEYFGTIPQMTGNGLPGTIAGTLKINNSAGISSLGVTLTNPITIDGLLDLTLGKLRTSSTTLCSISATGNISIFSSNSFVGGPLKITGHNSPYFPIGINAASAPTGTIFAPVNLVAWAGTSTSTDSYTAEYFRANPQTTIGAAIESPPINHISFVEYWNIVRNDAGSNTPTKIIILAVNEESFCYNLNTLLVARYDVPLSEWRNEGRNAVTQTGVSPPRVWGFLHSDPTINISGYFTLSTTDPFSANPLPINLISFDATKLSSSRSLLNWELAACCSSSAKFELQRAGGDRNFKTITIVSGSETNRFYDYTDHGLQSGINYYRLKMIDADGSVSYSKVLAVFNGTNGLLLTSLIPSVITSRASLTVASSTMQKMDILIVDMQGRVVQKQNYSITTGNTSITISAERLPAGVYQLVGIAATGKTNVIRFIKE